ncbi:hypothetical protein SAMN04487972_103238 [Paracoccus halophilus]|uniref:Uncharacterized protein n=1 Tax=Paracoccus halophilus TaxID=376733 RepID=A0A099F0N4_9RHOB|nr:hypothetical protein [Paracoccus halophilus]KGJ03994.1 hypothetical protein IT41_11860 [Paracoccus halophilus]SFA44617.1 hypothetical protein SAMN04487972_103238 [Paracoccus halophilus]
MKAPVIRNGGIPTQDGAVTRYLADELTGRPWYNPNKPVIFVNGMLNDGAGHAENATRLSAMLGASVYGVFNKSQGGLVDLVQCLTDKLKFASLQKPDQKVLAHGSPANLLLSKYLGPAALALPPRSDFGSWHAITEALYQLEKAAAPGLSKDDYVHGLLGDNAATRALYALLLAAPGGMLGTPIHAHSQGNLIVSNALTGVALARGAGAIRGLEVFSYGSPVQGWPDGLRRVNNALTFDGVGLLDLTMDWSSSKVGYRFSHGLNPLTHAFRYYAEADPEFVINRFRTGGWGMTVNMDEKGLARFLVSLGNNTERLKRIFDRLEKSHWSDSDDVALEYVGLLSDRELVALRDSDGGALVAQLIRLLGAGYLAGSERRAIERLRAIQPLS